jgi:hypothetical protein
MTVSPSLGSHRSISPSNQHRTGLHELLAARLPEIEQAILTRVHSVADPADVGDPAYIEGLRAAVHAALAYAIAALENDGARPAPLPAELLAQARRAARDGVPLDTVLRRYLAGYALLDDFIVQEAEAASGSGGAQLKGALRTEAAVLDHLIDAVAAEYRSEVEARSHSLHRRRAECVDRLLAGELTEAAELGYDLDAWHVGAIVAGLGAEQAIRDLATALDRRLLCVPRGEAVAWAWLGGRRKVDPEELERLSASSWPIEVYVAVGEPAQELDGWRFTHRQAIAAVPVAMRTPGKTTRYADVALLASMLQDETLTRSLNELYLAPLGSGRDGGEALRRTLRAYFSAGRNVSSTAASLGVERKTVTRRLHKVEGRIGRPLDACAAELEAILHLEELERLGASKGLDLWHFSSTRRPN